MQTPRMLSTVGTAAPVLTDAGVGVGVAVLVLAASQTGVGPPWISSPRPLDAVAVGLIGVVAGALALRRRYPIAVLVVLNAVALAWAAGRYPGRVILLAPLIACYTLAAARGWRWGLAGAAGTALSALVAIRVAFGAAEPAGTAGIAVWMAATAGAAGTAVGYYRALLAAYDEAKRQDACFTVRQLAITGRDLMGLGLSGPAVGETLRRLLWLVQSGELPNERAALLAVAGQRE